MAANLEAAQRDLRAAAAEVQRLQVAVAAMAAERDARVSGWGLLACFAISSRGSTSSRNRTQVVGGVAERDAGMIGVMVWVWAREVYVQCFSQPVNALHT